MRTAIILGWPREGHGGTPVTVSGPEIPVHDQMRRFKEIAGNRADLGGFGVVELWTSDAGRVKSVKFKPAPEAAAIPGAEPAAGEDVRAEGLEREEMEAAQEEPKKSNRRKNQS